MTPDATKIISLFSKIISKDSTEIDKSIKFILNNIQQVVDVAKNVALPNNAIEQFIKLAPDYEAQVGEHLDKMPVASFDKHQNLFEKLIGSSRSFENKKSQLEFQDSVAQITENICLLGVDYVPHMEKLIENLDKVDISKVEKITAYTLITEAFHPTIYYWENNFDLDLSKSMMDLYLNKNFIELTQNHCASDKKLKNKIENNIIETINGMTECSLLFSSEVSSGSIKKSEHAQILKIFEKIAVAHHLDLNTSKIKPAVEFTKRTEENFQLGAKKVSPEYFDKIQKNIDSFTSSLEK